MHRRVPDIATTDFENFGFLKILRFLRFWYDSGILDEYGKFHQLETISMSYEHQEGSPDDVLFPKVFHYIAKHARTPLATIQHLI